MSNITPDPYRVYQLESALEELQETVRKIAEANRPWLPGRRAEYDHLIESAWDQLCDQIRDIDVRATRNLSSLRGLQDTAQQERKTIERLRKDIRILKSQKAELRMGDFSKMDLADIMDLEDALQTEKEIHRLEREIKNVQASTKSSASSSSSTPKRSDYADNTAYLAALAIAASAPASGSSGSISTSDSSSTSSSSSSSSSWSSDSGSSFSGGFDGGGSF